MPEMVRVPGQAGLAPISEMSAQQSSPQQSSPQHAAADGAPSEQSFSPSVRRSPAPPSDQQLQDGAAAAAAAAHSGKVPISMKVAIGIGAAAMTSQSSINGFFLQIFLLETACLPARLVGTLQLMQGLFDALNDPIIGAHPRRRALDAHLP